MTQDTTYFGDREIPTAQKESLVRGVFDSVASRYDLMNDLMSGGLHRLWKNEMVAAVPLYKNMQLLDLAGGTGDIAFRFLEKSPVASRQSSAHTTGDWRLKTGDCGVTVCDINAAMLAEGRRRAIDRNLTAHIEWVEGNAESLPFDDHQFDACTIAFGIRNVTHIDRALREIHRVLKPGGKFLCLEFCPLPYHSPLVGESNPAQTDLVGGQSTKHKAHSTIPPTESASARGLASSAPPQGGSRLSPFAALYNLYSDNIIPAVGQAVTGDRESYEYLVQSIRRFPPPESFAAMIREAGFRRVDYRRMTGGVVALHWGWKI